MIPAPSRGPLRPIAKPPKAGLRDNEADEAGLKPCWQAIVGGVLEFSVAEPQKEIPSHGAPPLEIPWKSQTIRDDFRKFGHQLRLSLAPQKNVNKICVFEKKGTIIQNLNGFSELVLLSSSISLRGMGKE